MQVSVRPLLTLNLLSIELQRHPEAEQNVYRNVPSCFNTILLSQFQLDVSCGVIDSTLVDCTPGPYVLKPIWVPVDLYEPRTSILGDFGRAQLNTLESMPSARFSRPHAPYSAAANGKASRASWLCWCHSEIHRLMLVHRGAKMHY